MMDTNFDAITKTPETLTAFVDRVYRWGMVGGCTGCPVDEMFCEANINVDGAACDEVFKRWLQKPVRKGRA